MPSILTSSRSGQSGLSRVNSFKREWGDDGADQHPSSSASRPYEWSPSPERPKRENGVKLEPGVKREPPARLEYGAKPAIMPLPIPASKSDDNLTPAERRRKAILAAMNENAPAVLAPAPAQALPSLVDDPDLPAMKTTHLKRPMPWDSSFPIAKKVVSRSESSSLTSSTAPKKKNAKPHIPRISIRAKLCLSAEQQEVLRVVVQEGKNVFFTGSAGTGKSVLLRQIIDGLKKKYTAADAVAITASTGIAACNIGGVTLHSFGGAGLAEGDIQAVVKRVRMNKKAAARWTRTKALIIDEISMVDADLFDKFNKIARIMRKKDVPFGGMQIIVTGDFLQLPPVTRGTEPRFCFEATTWEESLDKQVVLTQVFRQKDQRFVDMLNEMRYGKLSRESIAAFNALSRPLSNDDGIEATELFPRREDVERANTQRLRALNTDSWSYEATDGGVANIDQRQKLLSSFMAPHMIEIRKDAQVMLIKNTSDTLVNGSMGKVIGFCHQSEFRISTANQWIPPGEDDDLEAVPEDKKEQLRDILKAKINPLAKPYPVVRFSVPGGGFQDSFVQPESWKTELPNGEVQASRSQIPLILAWAMSIHKAQGQTLEKVKVDLGKVFEKGQAYVALSRATSLEGLEVRGFRADKVIAHPKVVRWNNKLQTLGGSSVL